MIDPAFSAGPWFVRREGGLTIVASEHPQPGALFIADCSISSAYRSPEETEANAYLMAASPCLFKACRMALAKLEALHEEHNETGVALEEAIKKALPQFPAEKSSQS